MWIIKNKVAFQEENIFIFGKISLIRNNYKHNKYYYF